MRLCKKNDLNLLCKAIVCSLLPVLICLLYCALQGRSLGNIYLPGTTCSDDIFYYKMVEGAVEFGSPLGYFGYNESHAVVSSFGAWSPVLLMPWILWGKIFGWGYFSPIVCNICVMAFGFAVFAVMAKPTWKQIASIALLVSLVTPFTRYLLSGMAETFGYSLIFMIYGIVYSYFREEKKYKLALLFFLIVFLSLMRPYFMVFFLLPGALWMRRSKLWGMLGSMLVLFFNLAGYWLITHFFTAPFYESMMETDFVDAFQNGGLIAGCSFLLRKIYDQWILIRWQMSLGVRQGSTAGQIYFACCIGLLFLFLWLLSDIFRIRHRGGDEKSGTVRNIVMEAGLLIAMVVMLLAIIVLYAVMEGSRHVLAFLIGFIIVGTMRDGRSLEKNILIMAAFAFLFVVKYDSDTGYRVPYGEEDVVREVEDWSEQFSSCIHLECAGAPSYDNTVDWVIGEGEEVPWKVLFALPEGTGINCCLPTYMAEHIEELNSRYILTIPGGQTDLLCQEKEMIELLREESFVLYQNY